jgi:hypothetical protein
MRKMLLVIFFIPFFSAAQQNKFAEAFLGLKPDSNSRHIKLLPLWRSDVYKFYEVEEDIRLTRM